MVEKFWRHLEKLGDIFEKTCTQLWDNLVKFWNNIFGGPAQIALLGKAFLSKGAILTWAGAQVRNSSLESHLLKTVASGGPWHSEEKSEEALMTNPNFGVNCCQNALGQWLCQLEEEIERPC